jgi:hypothetical protein
MTAHRTRTERLAARLATGATGHLVCGVADWAELMGRYLLARRRSRRAVKPGA